MAFPVTANSLGKKLCDALKLDASAVTSVTLHAKAGHVARVEVTMPVSADQADAISEIVKQYELKDVSE